VRPVVQYYRARLTVRWHELHESEYIPIGRCSGRTICAERRCVQLNDPLTRSSDAGMRIRTASMAQAPEIRRPRDKSPTERRLEKVLFYESSQNASQKISTILTSIYGPTRLRYVIPGTIIRALQITNHKWGLRDFRRHTSSPTNISIRQRLPHNSELKTSTVVLFNHHHVL